MISLANLERTRQVCRAKGKALFGALSNNAVGIIERAFQIAREGRATSVTDIKAMLIREGYEAAPQHLTGLGIGRQLKAAIAESKKASR